MSKIAKTSVTINQLLANRWSPRAFSKKDISDESLLKMFEAARWAPSASNIQPWQFILGKKSDATYQKIFETLVEFNQMWAKNAPVLILNCADTTREDGTINETSGYDLGQAVAHFSIQAMSENIFVHQMSGFSKEKAVELFKLPENMEPISVMSIGYLGVSEMLHPRMQVSEKAERERKPLNEMLFQNELGEASDLIK